MSVYTEVSTEDLQYLIQRYNAGRLQSFTGIRDGIENSNYFVTTSRGEYVLTLFENSPVPEIEFTLRVMSHLANRGLPCAKPLADQQGRYLNRLSHKPASLVTRLHGRSVRNPTVAHCRAVGESLAKMHLAGQAILAPLANPRGAAWRHDTADRLRDRLNPEQAKLLDDELGFQQQGFAGLPRGFIHADLFRDNVLFAGKQLTGLIDLYNSGRDLLLYDLAITVNDWCTRPTGRFDNECLRALLHAYDQRRTVTAAEQAGWPTLLRRAALRFWLSRLYNHTYPRQGRLIQHKDPAVYQQLLHHYRQTRPEWPI